MSNIHIVNLSSYTTPEIKEYSNRDWVSYGEDNDYFQFLIDRYNGSPTNNAIINGISELIYGKGLDATDSSRKPEAYARMKSLFKKEDLRKATSDFKMMGQCAFQIIYSQDHQSINEVYHLPIETLRAEKCNDEGEIEGYYYAKSWNDVNSNRETPTRIPAFGFSREGIEVLYIKPYRAGFYYYSPVDYQGGLQYAELEEEVANYHLNNIKNGMSPSMLINFNNGVPTEEERYIIENKVAEKFSGSSNAGKFILAFNDNKELAASIEPVQLNDASQQYQFLADEAMRKIMVAHRVTSPMLLGIKDQTGLGNNADELMTASQLFDNIVIRPMQEVILDGLDKILAFNDISLDLYFKTLQPIEFTEAKVMDKATIEQETGVKMSSDNAPEFPNENEQEVIAYLKGKAESVDPDEWELISDKIVDDVDAEDEFLSKFKEVNFALDSFENADQDSRLDAGLYKVRYAYTENLSANSREFCREMVGLTKAGMVLRKEDIDMMSFSGVNGQFAPQGQSVYSIWKWKGGVYCHHSWRRLVYFRKRNTKGQFLPEAGLENDKIVSVADAEKAGFDQNKLFPSGWSIASTAPINTPSRGSLKNK